jgi:hypothetical protein
VAGDRPVSTLWENDGIKYGEVLFDHLSVECLEDDGHQVVTFGALNLFERLDVFVLGPVHDRKDFGDEVGFVARPVTARTSVQGFKHY